MKVLKWFLARSVRIPSRKVVSFTSATAEVKGFMAKMAFFRVEKTLGVCWPFFVVGGFVCQVLQDFCLFFFFWVWVCIDVQIGNLRPLVERSRKIRACRWPPGSYLPIDKPSFETPQTGTTDATEATTNLPMILKSTLRRRFYILFWKHIFVAGKKIPSLLDFWFKKILPKKLLQKTHLQEGRCHQCVCHPSSTWKSLQDDLSLLLVLSRWCHLWPGLRIYRRGGVGGLGWQTLKIQRGWWPVFFFFWGGGRNMNICAETWARP